MKRGWRVLSEILRLRSHFTFLSSCRLQLFFALLFGLFCGLASGFGVPVLLKFTAEKIFNDNLPIQQLVFYCSLPILLISIRTLSGFLNTFLLAVVGQHILLYIRMRIFRKLQRLPLEFFHRTSPGEIISKASNDATLIQSCFMSIAHDLIQCPITLLGSFSAIVYLCLAENKASMLLLISFLVALTIFPIWVLGRRIRRRNLVAQEEIARLTTRLTDNLEAVSEVRAFCLEDQETKRYEEAGVVYSRAYLRAIRSYYFINPSIELLAAIGVSAAMFYGHFLGIGGETFLALSSALYFSYDPIKNLGRMNGNVQSALASLSRIESLLHAPEAISDPEKPKKIPEKAPFVLEMQNVSLAYDNGETILQGINLRLERGKIYAVVGPSGAGKTSLAHLILRFYEATSGTVRFQGVAVKDLRQRDLRSQISLVPQQPSLLNDTVYNNILWGKERARNEEVLAAAELAGADGFIRHLEKSYETPIGEGGGCLSVGQRQRLALARAFLKPSRMMILDEATSALDVSSEEKIQKTLLSSFRDRTILLISHRFNFLPQVDEIFVMEGGRIIQHGPHQKLIQQEGLYKRLYLLHTN